MENMNQTISRIRIKFIMCWGSVLVLMLIMAESSGNQDTSSDGGERDALAEPLMGSITLPSLPASFPLSEFTNYGVQSHLMPSAPPGSAQDLTKGRLGRPYPSPGLRMETRTPVMPGSVPVNSYYNPTAGFHPRYPYIYQPHPSNPTLETSDGFPGVSSGVEKDVVLAGYSGASGGDPGGYGGASIAKMDPLDYTDYVEDDNQAQKGTLEAALHTLWSHRNDVYSSLEDLESAAVNHAWLDILRLHQPHPASHTRATHTPHTPRQEPSHTHPSEVYSSNVGTVYVPTTLKPKKYDQDPDLANGESELSLLMGGHHTPYNYPKNAVGGLIGSRVSPHQPVRVTGTLGDLKNMANPGVRAGVQPALRPGVGNRRIAMIHSAGSSGMFGLRPHRNQRPDLRQRPGGPRAQIQIVRPLKPVGRVGLSPPKEDSLQHTALLATSSQQADHQGYVTASWTPPINSLHVGMVTSSEFPGQEDHQANAENTHPVLTLAETMELAEMMDLPLQKVLLEKVSDSNVGLRNSVNVLQQQKGSNWLSRMGQVVSGVSNQLPSIDQAVTTMSFLAFGIFMANLIVQAVANSSSLITLLGREDVGSFTIFPLDFSLPLGFRNFEMDLNLEKNDTDNGMLKQVVEVISQVYISLHEMARAGVSQVVSAVGLEVPKSRIPPGFADLEPECLRRLLCEGHHVTSPFFQDTVSYRLLPFWTMGVSWLSGKSSVPMLLEELRAEVAGQQGLDCSSLFPECMDTAVIDMYLTQVESEVLHNQDLMTEDLSMEIGQGVAGDEVRYTNKHSISNNTDHNLKKYFDKDNFMPESLLNTSKHLSLLPQEVVHDKDRIRKIEILSEGGEAGQIT
ncbi:uncharacterized protein [Panulirus ornatus]|uniref:uncharacterized protein isoform X2 n=1 Tax=Panulirus ornatus TaxID=150431 RepID=UPI003A843450